MSTITLVEQRAPFILQLASRVPTYAHILISVLAIILFKAFPSLAIAKPPVRVISRKPRSESLTSSTTPTLADTDEAVDAKSKPEDVSVEEKEPHHRRLSFSTKLHLGHLGSSVKHFTKSVDVAEGGVEVKVVDGVAEEATVMDETARGEAESYIPGATSSKKKASAFKRAARRASVVLHITHRS
ncbi:hypothetical protein C0991_010088 [Blastosporella zonata]|nr:hypothetical protein C0991_010088 [Blastosporella zonata]